MAISKIGRNATDTGITDNSDSTAITISSAEVVDIELGDIIFSTAGKGICLGATSATAANTLHDYEEGTWTPSTPINMTASEGTYVKVGNLVTAHFNVTFPSSSDSGTIALMAGPFNSGGANKFGGGFLSFENALDSGNQTIMMYNQAVAQFVFVSGNTGLTLADVSGHQFLGTLVYTT